MAIPAEAGGKKKDKKKKKEDKKEPSKKTSTKDKERVKGKDKKDNKSSGKNLNDVFLIDCIKTNVLHAPQVSIVLQKYMSRASGFWSPCRLQWSTGGDFDMSV